MYNLTVPMALVDFIPVIFFAVSAHYLMRDLYYRLPKYGFAMLAAGTIDVFFAGFLKALWKLLYALGICDFQVLNKMMLPTQSLGFFMAGLAMVICVRSKTWKKELLTVAAPPVFSGKVLFLVMMVLGLGCMCTCLSIVAAKLKKKVAIPFFVLSFVFSMGMGYAGRLDSTAAWVNWLEQGINIASQACFMCGVLILHKTTLEK